MLNCPQGACCDELASRSECLPISVSCYNIGEILSHENVILILGSVDCELCLHEILLIINQFEYCSVTQELTHEIQLSMV